MNKWLKIGLGIAVVVIVAIASVFFLTSGMEKTADAFFNAVKQKDLAKARTCLSEDFIASSDENALKEFLSKGAILNFKKASWSNRQINGNAGQLDGSITTETGGVVPLKLTFVKERGDWKIYSIQKESAGLKADEHMPMMPGNAEQIALVKQSMHDFLVSVKNKDMSHFHSTISQMWRKQVTTEQMNAAFGSVIKSGADWSALDTLQPVLSPVMKIDEDGVLSLVGKYPTNPVLKFDIKYVYEGVSWKLIGFSIQAK
jgi:hypothetical protein